MLVEHLPQTPASRARRQRNLWPVIVAGLVLVGAIAGLLTAH